MKGLKVISKLKSNWEDFKNSDLKSKLITVGVIFILILGIVIPFGMLLDGCTGDYKVTTGIVVDKDFIPAHWEDSSWVDGDGNWHYDEDWVPDRWYVGLSYANGKYHKMIRVKEHTYLQVEIGSTVDVGVVVGGVTGGHYGVRIDRIPSR